MVARSHHPWAAFAPFSRPRARGPCGEPGSRRTTRWTSWSSREGLRRSRADHPDVRTDLPAAPARVCGCRRRDGAAARRRAGADRQRHVLAGAAVRAGGVADAPANAEIAERAVPAAGARGRTGPALLQRLDVSDPARARGGGSGQRAVLTWRRRISRRAVEAATRVGARPELARTYLDQAELLIAQGGTSHRSLTVELLKEAAAIFLDFECSRSRAPRAACPGARSQHPDHLALVARPIRTTSAIGKSTCWCR